MPVGAVHVITGPIGIGEIPFGLPDREVRGSPRAGQPQLAGGQARWTRRRPAAAETGVRGTYPMPDQGREGHICGRSWSDGPRPSCGTRTGRPKPRRYSSRPTPRARSAAPAESAGRGPRMRFGPWGVSGPRTGRFDAPARSRSRRRLPLAGNARGSVVKRSYADLTATLEASGRSLVSVQGWLTGGRRTNPWRSARFPMRKDATPQIRSRAPRVHAYRR